MQRIRTLIYISLTLLIACGPTAPEDRFKKETPEEKEEKLIDLSLKRLDHDFMKMDTTKMVAQIDSMKKRYGSLWDLYTVELIGVARPTDPEIGTKLSRYINDPFIQTVYAETEKTFPDANGFMPQLQKGFTRYKHFFPEKKVPTIVTCIAPFYKPIIATENELVIELDRFLGRKHGFYTEHPDFFPQYSLVGANKEYIASSALLSWVITDFQDNSKTLLDTIIHNGKALYIMDALLPDVADTIKLRYSAKQLEWCKNSEASIWAYIVDQKALYNTNGKIIANFVGEAPFTKGLPKESPGRVGDWVGLQIVKAYMAKNTKLTLQDLLNEHNAQTILAASGYRPKNK